MSTSTMTASALVVDLDASKSLQTPGLTDHQSSGYSSADFLERFQPRTRGPEARDRRADRVVIVDLPADSFTPISAAEREASHMRVIHFGEPKPDLGRNAVDYHMGYLAYLERCWALHRAPMVSPDVIWHGLLCEIASAVRENPTAVADLFTFTPDCKVEITVAGCAESEPLPVARVVLTLREFVPSGLDKYLHRFSTTGNSEYLAQCAAFCDVVSPFYSYGMLLCGFPKVVVTGTPQDWNRLLYAWETLPEKLATLLGNFHLDVYATLLRLWQSFEHAESAEGAESNRKFWSDMLRLERCGSGHQTEASGWITKLYRRQPEIRYVCNFDTHVSKISYKQVETGQRYRLHSGVMASTVDAEGVAVPHWGRVVLTES